LKDKVVDKYDQTKGYLSEKYDEAGQKKENLKDKIVDKYDQAKGYLSEKYDEAGKKKKN